MTKYCITQINKQNNADYKQRIQEFDCGHGGLNSYLKTQASQDSKRRIAILALFPLTAKTFLYFYRLIQYAPHKLKTSYY